jgi:large subunit ribosomal protein L1
MVEKKVTAKKAVKKSEGVSSKKEGRVRVQKFGRGKKYNEVVKSVEKNKLYTLAEGLELVKSTSPVKFDATVELHLQMGLDPKKPEQNIRGTVVLPAGSGKTPKILVLAESEDAAKAKKAGADYAGLDELIEKIGTGWLDFDLVIATPAVMPKVGKMGQTLGTKGLMPNPKSGTVTADVEKAVDEFKKGKVEYRLDKEAIVHLGLGKVSFATEDLKKNFDAVFAAVRNSKPATAKGAYIKRLSLSSTMGPGIKIDLGSIL